MLNLKALKRSIKINSVVGVFFLPAPLPQQDLSFQIAGRGLGEGKFWLFILVEVVAGIWGWVLIFLFTSPSPPHHVNTSMFFCIFLLDSEQKSKN